MGLREPKHGPERTIVVPDRLLNRFLHVEAERCRGVRAPTGNDEQAD
jgi:hypothetical protein